MTRHHRQILDQLTPWKVWTLSLSELTSCEQPFPGDIRYKSLPSTQDEIDFLAVPVSTSRGLY